MCPKMSPLQILIADGHEVFRRGVRAVLEEQREWQVVGEAENGQRAVELARQYQPQIVVLDIGMPEPNGIDAIRQILKACPACEILVLTLHESEQLAQEVLKAGARGYILKSDASRDLVTAVDALHRHMPFFTPKIAGMVLNGFLQAAIPGSGRRAMAKLTPREREIVQLLGEGKSNKGIASTLGISIKTAETHRANVMHKLGIRSRAELVQYALQNRFTTGRPA